MRIEQCTITLTRKCNLRCNFCYAKNTEYLEESTIKFENLKRIIDFCNEACVRYIVFTGGEPTLYSGLFDILKYIKRQENKMIPTIATNGILLENKEFCESLINNGIEYIDISLKGKNGKECCKTAGFDCFLQQEKAIRNLSTLPIEFTCSVVLTNENIESLCDIVKNARANGAKQFSFTFMIDNIKSEFCEESYLKWHNPFPLIDSFMSQIKILNSITEEWWIEYSFPMCIYPPDQLKILEGKMAHPCQVHTETGITFDTDMNLIPCNMYFENRIGRLDTDFSSYAEFLDFIQNSIYRTTIDQLKQLPSTVCKSCKFLKLCYGGCPVTWKNYSFDVLNDYKDKYYW